MGRKHTWTMGNSEVQHSSMKTLLGSAAFLKGFNDRIKGRPFDETIRCASKQWSYERGRLFGVVYQGQIKEGRTVIRAAIVAASIAYRDKVFT